MTFALHMARCPGDDVVNDVRQVVEDQAGGHSSATEGAGHVRTYGAGICGSANIDRSALPPAVAAQASVGHDLRSPHGTLTRRQVPTILGGEHHVDRFAVGIGEGVACRCWMIQHLHHVDRFAVGTGALAASRLRTETSYCRAIRQ